MIFVMVFTNPWGCSRFILITADAAFLPEEATQSSPSGCA